MVVFKPVSYNFPCNFVSQSSLLFLFSIAFLSVEGSSKMGLLCFNYDCMFRLKLFQIK